jgi:hypothetical protein
VGGVISAAGLLPSSRLSFSFAPSREIAFLLLQRMRREIEKGFTRRRKEEVKARSDCSAFGTAVFL